MELTLTRLPIKNQFATLGVLDGLKQQIFTLEDAWRGNRKGVSCIPTGRYKCVPHGWETNTKVKFVRVWQITGVEGREAILFHAGNGHEDTLGCVLVGVSLDVQAATIPAGKSRPAIEFMRQEIGPNNFWLTVK